MVSKGSCRCRVDPCQPDWRIAINSSNLANRSLAEDEIASGRTFPAISRIREISKEVACNVIEVALDENLCTKLSRKDVPTRDALSCFVDRKMYFPAYVPLVDPAYHRKD